MQISKNLLRVIFMLSTIVAVTDCCSSRILFLKEQTFNIIQQQKMQQYQQYNGHQPTDEKYEQHVYSGNTGAEQLNNNKNHTNINTDDETASDDQTGEGKANDRPPPSSSKEEEESVGVGVGVFRNFGKTLSNILLADVARGKKQVENNGHHLFDLYESIMNNVLSNACTGQFLTDFCLNGGRCFSVPMGNQSLFSCECADDYVGERCESKSVNGVFVPTSALDNKKRKILTARIVFSFPMLILLTVIYLFFGMMIVFKCQPSFRITQSSRAAGLLFT